MPIPQPTTDEDKGTFIARCIIDEKMKQEYPNLQQRYAVCVAQYDKE